MDRLLWLSLHLNNLPHKSHYSKPHLQRYFRLCRFVEGFLQCRKHRRACRQRRGQTSPQAAIRSQSTSYTFSVWFVLSLYFSFYSPSVCAYTHYLIYFILYIQSKQSFYWTICKFFQKIFNKKSETSSHTSLETLFILRLYLKTNVIPSVSVGIRRSECGFASTYTSQHSLLSRNENRKNRIYPLAHKVRSTKQIIWRNCGRIFCPCLN